MAKRPMCKKGTKPKRMYRDKIAALLALADMQWKDSSTRGKIETRVYFHRPCGTWHTTSKPLEDWREQSKKHNLSKTS